MHSITSEIPCAKGWRVASLDTASLFSYFKGPFKEEDLTPGVTNMVASVCEELVAVWQRQWQQGHDTVTAKSTLRALVNELYYRVLQFIMQELYPCILEERGRQKRVAVSPTAHKVLQRQELHTGVLHCALSLVCYELGITECDITTILNTHHCMLAVWEATRWFEECFSSPATGCSMSEACVQLLAGIKQTAEGSLVLQQGSSFFDAVFKGGGFAYADSSMCTDSSMGLVHSFMKAAGHSVVRQLEAALRFLMSQSEIVWRMSKLQLWRTCQMATDMILLHRFDILFDVHQAVVVVALLYGSFRMFKDQVDKASLKLITSSVEAAWIGVPVPAGTFTSVRLRQYATDGECATTTGDLRAYYNQVFCTQCGDLIRAAAQQAAADVEALASKHLAATTQHVSVPNTQCPAAAVIAGTSTADAAGSVPHHKQKQLAADAVEGKLGSKGAHTPARQALQPIVESTVSDRVNRDMGQLEMQQLAVPDGSCTEASDPRCHPDPMCALGKKRPLRRLTLLQQQPDNNALMAGGMDQHKENMPLPPPYKLHKRGSTSHTSPLMHVTGVMVVDGA